MTAAATDTAPSLAAHDQGYVELNIGSYLPGDIALLPNGDLQTSSSLGLNRWLADGSPDLSFNFGGAVRLPINVSGVLNFRQIDHSVMLPDGKMLLVGTARDATKSTVSEFLDVIRLNADGSPDTSFGSGKAEVHAVTNADAYLSVAGSAILKDGSVMVVTNNWDHDAQGDRGQSTPQHVSLTHILANGTVDSKFGTQGTVIDDQQFHANAVSVQADGKVLISGMVVNAANPGLYDFGVVRYNTDGSRDDSFGDHGLVQQKFTGNGLANDIAVQPDGKILVVGSAVMATATSPYDNVLVVMRLNADGSPDADFASAGVLAGVLPNTSGNSGRMMHLNEDGSILVATLSDTGLGQEQLVLTRILSNGQQDTHFGDHGLAIMPTDSSTDLELSGMAVNAKGEIFIHGASVPKAGGGLTPTIYKFAADGQPDGDFGPALTSIKDSQLDYQQGHLDQYLNPHISVTDNELNSTGYAGASVTLARDGGADKADQFLAGGALSFSNGHALVNGVDIGSLTNANGSLRIVFNGQATQDLVNSALHGIVYQNSSAFADGDQVTLNWTFSDGQLSDQASTQVTLHQAQVPYWIDGLLHRAGDESAQQLSARLNELIGSTHHLDLHFVADAGTPAYSAADQAYLKQVLAKLTGVTGLQLGSDGLDLNLHNSPQLAAGQSAATAIDMGGGGNVYFSFGADGSSANQTANSGALLQALGLALGLKQSELPAADDHSNFSLMSPGAATTATSGIQSLGVLDIAALQYLYGPNPAQRAGNDTYQLSATSSNFIWDGGGTDTISAAGLDSNLTLHLDPGHWDYLGSQGASITAAGQVTINYGSKIENAIGGNGDDHLIGNAGDNVLQGGAGNDVLEGGGGNDTLDGGSGVNQAVYQGARASYTLTKTATGWTVSDNTGVEGTDTLTHVQRLQFGDQNIALDIDGAAGQVYRLYQAAFDRTPDLSGIGYWMAMQDKGGSLHDIANSFVHSSEFVQLYGANASNEAFTTLLYNNVLHRAPDPDGLAFWVNALQHGMSQVDLLVSFSESTENQAALLGQIGQGFAYTPFH